MKLDAVDLFSTNHKFLMKRWKKAEFKKKSRIWGKKGDDLDISRYKIVDKITQLLWCFKNRRESKFRDFVLFLWPS